MNTQEKIKIFIYNKKGELIKKYFYNDFIYAFNEIIDHNIKYKNDEWNLINGLEFPPFGLIWNDEKKNWSKKDNQIFKTNKFENLIDFFK
jgi:hypothetical protein